jgi:hypothetical protein
MSSSWRSRRSERFGQGRCEPAGLPSSPRVQADHDYPRRMVRVPRPGQPRCNHVVAGWRRHPQVSAGSAPQPLRGIHAPLRPILDPLDTLRELQAPGVAGRRTGGDRKRDRFPGLPFYIQMFGVVRHKPSSCPVYLSVENRLSSMTRLFVWNMQSDLAKGQTGYRHEFRRSGEIRCQSPLCGVRLHGHAWPLPGDICDALY